jgi:hypothetical protein
MVILSNKVQFVGLNPTQVRYTTLSDKVTWSGRWFSPGIPVSPTNKTDRHDITEILLKEALITVNLSLSLNQILCPHFHVDILRRSFK